MPQDIVILPTYDRPEMLWFCLEHLAASPDIQSVQIRVMVDAHIGQPPPPKADIKAVVEKFPQLSIQIGFRPSHPYHGNSFNVLMAYKDAYETQAEYVYLVEDDVMVHPLFFGWHRHQHENDKEIGASIGVVKEPFHSHYASWGVCFKRETLSLILPHCKAAYFQNMTGYCRARFLPSKVHCEQDGLFCRVLARHTVVYATTPLAQHVGWYGYHRPRGVRPKGTLDERYEQVKRALASVESLRGVVRDKFGDVHPLQLDPCN